MALKRLIKPRWVSIQVKSSLYAISGSLLLSQLLNKHLTLLPNFYFVTYGKIKKSFGTQVLRDDSRFRFYARVLPHLNFELGV